MKRPGHDRVYDRASVRRSHVRRGHDGHHAGQTSENFRSEWPPGYNQMLERY
jgi:hypothetical protein